MDEFQHFERLAADNDFEEGQWIGGEFVYTKRKRKAQQTEDDRLYGVFQGSSEDDGEGFGGRRKKKSDDGRALHKEVEFVSKGVVTNTTEQLDETKDGEEKEIKLGLGISSRRPVGIMSNYGSADDTGEDSDEGGPVAAGTSGTARMIQQAAEQRRAAAEAAQAQASQRRQVIKADPELAKFENHSKGIGSKLLKMMGWKPGEGLGSQRSGISKPLIASLRPKLAGLGAAGSEKGLEDPGAKKDDKQGKEKRKGESKGRTSAVKEAWKTRNRRKSEVKEVFKTAEDLLNEQEEEQGRAGVRASAGGVGMTVLDMTGPQTRVVTDLGKLGEGRGDGGDGDVGIAFPELQHNLKLLVEMAEGDIQAMDAKGRQQQDTAVHLGEEEERLRKEAEGLEEELERATEVLETIQIVEQRRKMEPVHPDELHAVFATLRTEFPTEFTLFDCAAIALYLLLPILCTAMATWAPLQAPLLWLPAFTAWKPLLDTCAPQAAVAYAPISQPTHPSKAFLGEPFSELIMGTLFAPLQRAIMSGWNPVEPGSLITFFDHWSPIMPPAVRHHFASVLVLPRLRHAVDAWLPHAAAPPLHVWLHPWLPYLEAELRDMYAIIRTKIGLSLQGWRPWETTALSVLQPWHQLWEPKHWTALTDRVVLPPLRDAMKEMLSLNPLSTDTRPCEWLAPWLPLLSTSQVAGLYESAFFPELHRVLHTWLSHEGVIYDEVWPWFEAMKRTHLSPPLAEEPRCRHQLSVGFNAIHSSQSSLPLPHGYPVVPPLASLGAPGSAAVGREAAMEAAAEEELQQRGIKEFLAEQAEVAGLTFHPRAGRMVGGFQVYALGSISVVVDVHAGTLNVFMGDRWVPMSIERAIQQAMNKA